MSGDQGGEDQNSSGAGAARPAEALMADPAISSGQTEDIDALIKAAALRILASLSDIEARMTGEQAGQQQRAAPVQQGQGLAARGEPAETPASPVAHPSEFETSSPAEDLGRSIAEAPATADQSRTEPLEVAIAPAIGSAAASEPVSSEFRLSPDFMQPGPAKADDSKAWFAGPWTFGRVARYAGLAVGAYFGAVLFLILIYRFINPPTTTLIAYQWLTGTQIEQDWVPIEDISPNLLRAVVVSEDWGFCNHYGVDLDAIEKALEQAGEGKIARGASTISMQVIKNLFLSQSKSYLRKAIEIPLTFVAEVVWPKARMLEIYLNIAEWGPGIFGAEAAARHHFNKPASRLTEREAALLAAALPNPILRDAGDPGTRTARKASVIQSRMRAAGPVANCAMPSKPRSAADPPAEGWQTTIKKRTGAT